ncbi:MAG: endonuclease MutS2 [Eubacteriales bacterium]|nr:endonuclease MutS2 [Clostridiales bacterium]MDY5732541.1 endonuclease MutS2 [Eubacteriales bacterium]
MDKKILETLEYDKITAMLETHARCQIGKERARKLEPLTELAELNAELDLTSEAEAVLFRLGQSPVDEFPDTRDTLKRIKAVSALSMRELLDIASCLRAIRIAKSALTKESDQMRLAAMAVNLPSYKFIEDELNRCILNEDEMFDGASPALSRIRRELRVANEKVREKLNSMIRSSTYQQYLQDPIITMRNGRFVIPVKQEYRKQIPGLIHDQSGSGQTLFIEPAAVVELGNTFKKLLAQERDEIERILSELTSMVAPYGEDIYNALILLGEIDLRFAKAQLARDMNAVRPEMNDELRIRIVRGRHPLLDKAKAVPIDIWLGEDFKTLIITGPNTGGKTVTLKTVGLFTLMAQAGMFVPADVGTRLGVFKNVYADIGDEQSIEQSLSTFSSHMTRLVGILKNADDKSLVLLDELGAGTDPIEGAALAMSILETLYGRRSTTLATTHYSEIKAFALARDGMENASMEFDIDKLCPTYRLFIGIPGKSNAFEISKRLGLDDDVINRAKQFLKGEDVRFEDVISGAESQRRIAEQERKLAEQARAELDALRAEVEKEKKKLEETKKGYQAKAREDARRVVADTKREMERLIVQIRSMKSINQSEADRVIQASRDAVRERENALVEPEKKVVDMSVAPKSVNPGDEVRIVSLENKKATVLKKPDAKGDVLVQAGIMKIAVRLDDLRLLNEPAKKGPQTDAAAGKVTLGDKSVGLSIDVRGKLVDEAIIEVDRYLENAAMNGLNEVMIIHGKGTGALRAGIQSYLKTHRLVESFRQGAYGEGDAGVTAVTIKKL